MKRLLTVLVMAALITTGAFAELILGITGVQYFDSDATGIRSAWEQLQQGEGVYWGGYIELTGKNLGLGVSYNFDPKTSKYDNTTLAKTWDMTSYDVNLYLTYHLFGPKAFLDPFATLGIGYMGYDYANKNDQISKLESEGYTNMYIDKDSPLYASPYWDAGLGLGLNIGSIGIFVKGVYNKNISGFMKGKAGSNGFLYYDRAGNNSFYNSGESYDILPYFTMPFKWVFGAKLIL